MPTERFNGDHKEGGPMLDFLERKLIRWAVPRVPKWLETQHLTLLTLVWCVAIMGFSWLARSDETWLWMVSFFIICQYLTDALEGAVGRHRRSGLVKWGYYMDHLLDYFFLCAVLIGYAMLTSYQYPMLRFFVLALCGGYMVNSFLAFGATHEFRLVHLGLGPTELRLVFILINLSILFFGKTHLAPALPYVLGFCFLGLCYIVYKTQRDLWMRDMEDKRKKEL